MNRLSFLKACATALVAVSTLISMATAAPPKLEKTDLKFGFIKLTDCVPIIIAKELNYFEDEGLYVTVEAQSNWKILLDRVISGELDGAHMLAGQPIAATIGFRHQGACHHGVQHGPQRQWHHARATPSGSR
jgi:nitrate/nitrite transport system substrate-binding protein